MRVQPGISPVNGASLWLTVILPSTKSKAVSWLWLMSTLSICQLDPLRPTPRGRGRGPECVNMQRVVHLNVEGIRGPCGRDLVAVEPIPERPALRIRIPSCGGVLG
jgi:hypothetical protein